MAYAKITLKNNESGAVKEAPLGFSWSLLFCGMFVPLARRDWLWVLILVVPTILSVWVGPGYFAYVSAFGTLLNIAIAAVYNRIYIRNLLHRGFVISHIEEKDLNKIKQKNAELFA
ncbi:hypothetical protein [Vibrio gallicus]|uniref:hypothetical protein n=1 Tax=Vibrio gallicus TaxID=190897 RepID=UPI0021C348BE|nr:hypothetical protein [Vibrio gallicus]